MEVEQGPRKLRVTQDGFTSNGQRRFESPDKQLKSLLPPGWKNLASSIFNEALGVTRETDRSNYPTSVAANTRLVENPSTAQGKKTNGNGQSGNWENYFTKRTRGGYHGGHIISAALFQDDDENANSDGNLIPMTIEQNKGEQEKEDSIVRRLSNPVRLQRNIEYGGTYNVSVKQLREGAPLKWEEIRKNKDALPDTESYSLQSVIPRKITYNMNPIPNGDGNGIEPYKSVFFDQTGYTSEAERPIKTVANLKELLQQKGLFNLLSNELREGLGLL